MLKKKILGFKFKYNWYNKINNGSIKIFLNFIYMECINQQVDKKRFYFYRKYVMYQFEKQIFQLF